MLKLSEKLIGFMETNQAISEEDREVYEYAIESVWILGGNIVTSLLIGFGLKVPWYCVLLLLAIIFLRSDAGGYHATTVWRCYFMSCMVLVLSLLWVKAEIPCQTAITVCMAIPSYLMILRYAPLEAENKPLDETEKQVIGRRARVIATVEMAAGLACFLIDKRAAYAILCAVVSCGAGYVGWFIKKKKSERGCET